MRKLATTPIALALALLAAGCGSSSEAGTAGNAGATSKAAATQAPSGLAISGPGVRATPPPWKPEYAHMPARLHAMGLPSPGNEKFHIHAMLHIYVNGLLVPLPADIGIDRAKHLETSLHTHDGTGIIHMEAPHRFRFTLGDFFKVWGVKLGPAQLGSLTGLGGDKLHFYVNGQTLQNPAAYVLHKGDNIVIGYGADSSFPHKPSTFLLYEVEHGKGGLGCSSAPHAKGKKSCAITGAKPKKS
jgi:hypothetical protein